MNVGIGILVFFVALIALVAEFILYFLLGMGASFSGDITSLGGLAFAFVGVMVLTGSAGALFLICSILATLTNSKEFWRNVFLIFMGIVSIVYFIIMPFTAVNSGKVTQDKEPTIIKNSDDSKGQKSSLPISKEEDFRRAKWGMSKAEVKKLEEIGELQDEEDNIIVYDGTVAGESAFISYIFTQNRLTAGHYLFKVKHSNKSDYISDYKRLKALLIKKYGSPNQDKTIWKDDLYKDDYGMALSLGFLQYMAIWEKEKTEIVIMLSGENFDVKLQIVYKSKVLENLMEESLEQENLKGL